MRLSGRPWAALGIMLLSVLAYSFIPLVIVSAGGAGNPFLFNGAWRLGLGFGVLLFLAVSAGGTAFRLELLPQLVARMRSWTFLAVLGGCFDQAFFAWSTCYMDPSVSVVLMELWPLVFVILAVSMGMGRMSFTRDVLWVMAVLLSGLGGSVLVFMSASGGLDFGGGIWPGAPLALLASLSAGLTAFHFRWGWQVAECVFGDLSVRSVLFGTAFSYVVSSLAGGVASGAVGLVSGGWLPAWALLSAFAGGLALHSVGGILFRLSNLLASSLAVNVLNYLIPVVGLVWLWVAGEVGVARTEYLVSGVGLVVAANAAGAVLCWRGAGEPET